MRLGLVAVILVMSVDRGSGGEVKFDLGVMGGGAVSPDGSTLVVSLTTKTQLVYFDTVAGKETKRVTVEFQPTAMAWGDKVLFVAQKSSGQVHVLDAATGKELATGNAQAPVRNLVMAKGVCFASTDNRQVFAIDATGKTTKTDAQGSFIAADPKGAFVCTVIDGRARTDINKYTVDGVKLTPAGSLQGRGGSNLANVQGVVISADGKQVGVVAGGGWSGVDRKVHYSVPMYSTDDMQSQLGELETGPYPSGAAFHPVLPLVFACTGKQGTVFGAKSYAPGQKLDAPIDIPGAGNQKVVAFVAQGRKLAWASSNANMGVLKIYDLDLTPEQQAELKKAGK
jgi:hypothetical protein